MQALKNLKRWPIAIAAVTLSALSLAAVAFASAVNVAVVDVTAPNNSVTLAPGASAPVTINMTVTGNQDGTATFEVYRNWTLSGGTFTGSNPQEFTVAPRNSSDPATNFSTTGTVSVASTQTATTTTLRVGAFDITNSNTSGGKLAAGSSSSYDVTVTSPPPPSDTTPPAIGNTLVPATPDGDNGWYRGDVSLAWSVVENESPGSLTKTGCVNQNVTSDQTATTYACSATSTGGSAGPVNVTIKRDGTAPVVTRNIGGDDCSVPGSDGWCRGTRTAGFAATDATSGLANVAQATFTQSTSDEGANVQIASGSVKDKAGNTNPGIEAGPFKIDSTLPTISASAVKLAAGSPAYTADTWTNDSVRVSFACADGGSGTTSTLTGADVSAEGAAHEVTSTGTCADAAGNQASPASSTFGPIKVDKTKPVVTAHTGGYTSGSWTNQDVTVTFSCADVGAVQSGLATDSVGGGGTQTDESATSAGNPVTSTGACVDRAGNAADAKTVTVKIDKTNPVIGADTGGYTPGAWTNQDVTIAFACSDSLSGKAADSVGGDQTLSSETDGTDVTSTGTCTDEAGNSAAARTVNVKIDKTEPLIGVDTGGYTPGTWTNEDVTVAFDCADTGDVQSGIESHTVTGGGTQTADTGADGVDYDSSGACTDRAGNSADPQTVNVKLDKTKPTIDGSAAPPANAAGWNDEDVTVSFDCDDSGSGVEDCTDPVTLDREGRGQSVTGDVTDKAGNGASDTVEPIDIDKTAPGAPDASFSKTAVNGWFKDSVTVSYGNSSDPDLDDPRDVADKSGSGVGDGYSANETFNTSGTHGYSGTATDRAGNVSSATAGSVQVDADPPSIQIAGCPSQVKFGTLTTVNVTASDGQSGLVSDPSGSQLLMTGDRVGAHSKTFEVRDNVGHVSTATCNYAVVYDWTGFLAPIDNPSTGKMNAVKAGSSVPVKFKLGGDAGLNVFASGSPSSRQLSCDTQADLSTDTPTTTAGASTLSYDPTTLVYTYVWKTDKAWAGTCRLLTVELADGTKHTAYFKAMK